MKNTCHNTNPHDFSQGKLSQCIINLKTTKDGLATMDNFSKQIYDAGINDGRKEGKAEGKTEGKTEEKFATAKRMLALGKILQDIILITDLPMSIIQELQTEVKPA